MVFARKTDDALASLVKQLDKVVAANQDKKMASVLNLLGEDADKLKTSAAAFAKKNEIANIALVVPRDNENGPKSYKLNPKAEITVLIYRGLKVKANHALAAGELNEKTIKAIIADTGKILE
jgi:hypothetical protein